MYSCTPLHACMLTMTKPHAHKNNEPQIAFHYVECLHSIVILVLGDPDPPLDLTHDMSANTVSSAVIRWDPPSTTGGDGISITGYRIMSSTNGVNLNETVGDMNYTITGLQYNTDYSVNVTVINLCGQESEPASVVVNIEARG